MGYRMSSLALQLFVNINKILERFPGANPGANYAKQLVDQLRIEYPRLIACSDPKNAHTHALSAFALSTGLRDLRHQDPRRADLLAPAVKHALEVADEHLENLAEDELNLVLSAHEHYKSYLIQKNERDDFSATTWGRARGATDQLPLATVNGEQGVASPISWKPSHSQDITQRMSASHLNLGEISLHDIDTASTGAQSFVTDEFDISEPSGHRPQILSVEIPDHASPHISAQRAFLDNDAERDFVKPDNEIVPESVTSWSRRQKEMNAAHNMPAGTWSGPDMGEGRGEGILGRYDHDLPTDYDSHSLTEGSEAYESTFMHSESAPDRVPRREIPAARPERKTLLIWAVAPVGLAIPPVAFFQAGILWSKKRKAESVLLIALGLASSTFFLLWGMGRI